MRSEERETSPFSTTTAYLDVFMHANSHLFAIIFEQMCFHADLFLLFHVRYE